MDNKSGHKRKIFLLKAKSSILAQDRETDNHAIIALQYSPSALTNLTLKAL